MTCREISEFLLGYVEGELETDVCARFEQHLARCPNCVVYLEQYRTTIVVGRAAFEDRESPDAADPPEELVRAIIDAMRRTD